MRQQHNTPNTEQPNDDDLQLSLESIEIPVRSPDHLLIRYSADYVLIGSKALYFIGYEAEINRKRTL